MFIWSALHTYIYMYIYAHVETMETDKFEVKFL